MGKNVANSLHSVKNTKVTGWKDEAIKVPAYTLYQLFKSYRGIKGLRSADAHFGAFGPAWTKLKESNFWPKKLPGLMVLSP